MVAHNLAYRFSTVLRTFVLDVLERIQTARARLLHSVPGSCRHFVGDSATWP